MTDLSDTIVPKSDQLNADDLLAGPRTITIAKVSRCAEADQPIAVNFDGDGGKPYKPCKSMRRVMVAVWGPDASQYPGRRLTLYRDPSVTWGGMEVGGIRISHMSHIDGKVVLALTATKKARKPYTVLPLPDLPATEDKAALAAAGLIARADAAETEADVEAIEADPQAKKIRDRLASVRPELARDVDAALMGARGRVASRPDDGWPGPDVNAA